jgi:hypothetical protein
MSFPNPPVKIVPFGGAKVEPYDIGRQFDEHARSIKDVIDFLRTLIRDDGQLRQLAEIQAKTATPRNAPLATGVLGPNVGGPFGVDPQGASATAQDWSQVSIEWAEHMPDTIPPNILAMTAITGQHWSSRWWAAKAAGAFGMLAWWYMGAWPDPGPPTTPYTQDGQPIPVGAMYFNTTHNVLMVWNGSVWVSTLPGSSKTITQSLYYHATAGQTVFPLTVNDYYGHNFSYNQTITEGTQVIVNGDRVEPNTFSINVPTSVVTFTNPITPAGTLVVFDILTPPSQFAAGICLVNPIAPDGTATTFGSLTIVSGGTPVNATRSEDLSVSLDGVIQEPVIDYTAFGNSITFTTPPAADSVVFMIFFGPVAGGGSGGGGGGGGGSGGFNVVVGDAPPGSPANGALWFDTVGGNLYIWFNDGSSAQWVIVTHSLPGLTGPAGAQGPTGAASVVPGPAGSPGAAGAPGPPGVMTQYGQAGSVYMTVNTSAWSYTVGTVGYTGQQMVNYGGSWQQIAAYAAISNVTGTVEWVYWHQRYI